MIYSENPSRKGRVYSDSVINVCLYFSITFVTLLHTFILSLVVKLRLLQLFIYDQYILLLLSPIGIKPVQKT